MAYNQQQQQQQQQQLPQYAQQQQPSPQYASSAGYPQQQQRSAPAPPQQGSLYRSDSMSNSGPPPGHDMVSAEQYRYALTNFRIAHEQVEKQRRQLEEQERQVALLRERIAVLEGGDNQGMMKANSRAGKSSVDDFSIRNEASKLERLINRWAADVVRHMPGSLGEVYNACRADLGGYEILGPTATLVQNVLRHALSEAISEGIINCLIVTNSPETNVQLTRIHDHIFQRDPTVASVWRRQTFSAAVEAFTTEMSDFILNENIPTIGKFIFAPNPSPQAGVVSTGLRGILNSGYEFSRMLHASKASSGGTSGGTDAFYRAFVPELGSVLYPARIELLKRCRKHELGEIDRVGACVFPGLVKVARGAHGAPANGEDGQSVVRRAQVVCECALGLGDAIVAPLGAVAPSGIEENLEQLRV